MNDNEIIFSTLPGKEGYLGHILLNRPRVLNAISFSMFEQLHAQLLQWQENSDIKAVIIQGSGERVFSVGGDLYSVYQNKNKISREENLFRRVYSVNKTIHHFTKPYIALLDGMTMGAGAGVSFHGSHRVATERFVFAMPETAIGFFPDVGIGYLLSRCIHKIGYYLGLTGHRINAADAQYLGFVTHTIPSDRQSDLIAALTQTELANDPFDTVSTIIQQFAISHPPGHFIEHEKNIASCFSATTIEEIIARLKALNSPWAQSTCDFFLKQSPTSLKVTLEQLRRAADMPFDVMIDMDLNINFQFLQSHDFYEGIRALIIDKDKNPKWQPPTLAEVTPTQVEAFFTGKERL